MISTHTHIYVPYFATKIRYFVDAPTGLASYRPEFGWLATLTYLSSFLMQWWVILSSESTALSNNLHIPPQKPSQLPPRPELPKHGTLTDSWVRC